MILLVGIPSEPPLAMVGEELRRRGTPFEFVNQRDVGGHAIAVELSASGVDGTVWLHGRELRLSEIVGAYTRVTDPGVIPELAGRDGMRALRFQHLLSTVLESSGATVVNRIRPMETNASKPFQLQLIREFLPVPDTLVTNDVAAVRGFVERFGVVYKSVSGERSIVVELESEELDRLEISLRVCPVQFQRRIDGVAWRVHVVGTKIHACTIETEGLDYRYAQQHGHDAPKLRAVDLPESWGDACRRLTAALGLEFSGIDLVVDRDGVPWCLEVNTCPAYSYFELGTGQPIARSLACHLSGRGDCGCGCSA